MEIKKIEVNGNNYQFVNSSRNTRSGFAHDTTLFKNDCEIADCSCHYLNRTWECYRYQTVMQRCISEEIDREYNRFIENYKHSNNIKRMTAEKRCLADIEFENQADIKELREVYKQLEYRY